MMTKSVAQGLHIQHYLIILLTCFSGYFVRSQTVISGELRPRTEYRHGFKTLVYSFDKPAFFISQRTRLNFEHKTSSLEVKITLQDVRVWGSQPQLNTTDGLTSIHEAWGKLDLNKRLSLKLGRQEIKYDDHRIFGNVGWAQQGRSHDAALLAFTDSSIDVHLGLAYNQDKANLYGNIATAGSYKMFQYLWVHKEWKSLNGSFLFLNNGLQVIELDSIGSQTAWVNFNQTVGTRFNLKLKKLESHLAGYYQFGIDGDTQNSRIEAYNLKLDFNYKFGDKMSISTGAEILSGRSETNPGSVNTSFNPWFTTHHGVNGLMDYFYGGTHYRSVGLNDLFIGLRSKIKQLSIGFDVHYFIANSDVRDDNTFLSTGNTQALDPYLGTEFDFTLGFKIAKDVPVKIGYSHLFPAAGMQGIKGGHLDVVQNWAWLMITMKPIFFKKDK